MKSKYATIYKSKDMYILHSDSYSTVGVLLATEPFLKLEVSSEKAELSEAIKLVISASKDNIPHPTNFNGSASQYAKSMGCTVKKLHDAFMCCALEDDGMNITVIPTMNKGSKNGWIHLINKKILIGRNADDKDLVEAIDKAFEDCEVW